MNGWGLGPMRSTGLVWGTGELLTSELGCERVRARRWHEPLLARLQQDHNDGGSAACGWFADEVLPWIRKQAARAVQRTNGTLWLRYLNDLDAETAAYVRFVLGGSQVFRIAAHLQHREDFLDVERPLTLPAALPYPSFFLALERHPAFAVWDDVRVPEPIDGCFVNRLPDGSLGLHFTLRGDQTASGLPGVGVRLLTPGDDAPTTIRAWATQSLQAQEPVLEGSLPSLAVAARCQRERDLATAGLRRQTAARVHAVACALNRVLRLLDRLAELQRQDTSLSLRGLSSSAEAQLLAMRARSAPAAPRTVELVLKPVPGLPFGVGHFRVTGPVSPHWRRSHWRHQPCGPGREQCRLVRIQSTKVGETEASAGARSYSVQP